MTAGAQRYATLWSGDIQPNFEDMKHQVRSLQLAGMSGFPFWGHDAGGFYDWIAQKGPDESLYRKWSMALGSFSPIWKPHGMGQSRWPLDRSHLSQQSAKLHATLRYKLMSYTYSFAQSAALGELPIARPMFIQYPRHEKAWTYDLQYMWGSELLVAPNCTPENSVQIWLPDGAWYNYWNDGKIKGDQLIRFTPCNDQVPLFVKAGGIVPMTKYELSTQYIDDQYLEIHVYTGANGQFQLLEDDGKSEEYRTGRTRRTFMTYEDGAFQFELYTKGWYQGMNEKRHYFIIFHGVNEYIPLRFYNQRVTQTNSLKSLQKEALTAYFDEEKKLQYVNIPMQAIHEEIELRPGND